MLTEKRLRQLDSMVAGITPAELNEKLAAGEIFVLVEISEPDEFQKGHIDDALNLQIEGVVEGALRKFAKFTQIVLYATESASGVASTAARLLQHAGFTNVLVLRDGKEAWLNSGLPLAGGDKTAEA